MTKEMFYSRVVLALLAVCGLAFAAGFIFQSPVMVIGSFMVFMFMMLGISNKKDIVDRLKHEIDRLDRQQMEELDDYIDAKLIKQEK